MFKLLSKNDADVLKDFRIKKSAEFFADANAFFDVYSQIFEEKKDNLPAFMFDDKNGYSLDGICLFILSYSSQFNFATQKLSVDYLKSIYYYLASLSIDQKVVSKDYLIGEYLVFKNNTKIALQKEQEKANGISKKYYEAKDNFNKKKAQNSKYNFRQKLFLSIAIISLITLLYLSTLSIAFYNLNMIDLKVAKVYTTASVALALVLFIEFKFLSKYCKTAFLETSYELKHFLRRKDELFVELKKTEMLSCELYCNNYEFNKNLSYKIYDILPFAKIIAMAKKNEKDFSQDLVKDDTRFVLEQISKVGQENANDLISIYNQINEKDYLKYNSFVRLCFLNVFYEVACFNNSWKIKYDAKEENPFGLDLFELQFEKIAYLPKRNGLFVASNFDKYSNIKKYSDIKNVKENQDSETYFNLLKVQYLKHFFDLEKLSGYDNLFKDRKIYNVEISNEIMIDYCKLPTIVEMKLNLLKSKLNLLPISYKNIEKILSRIK